VFPNHKLFHCQLSADSLRSLHLNRLRVEWVEPSRREPPAADSRAAHTFELRPLLWDLTPHGARSGCSTACT